MDDNDRFEAQVFGILISTLRNQRQMNQTDFGQLVGMSQVKVSRIEKGKVRPDASLIRKFAQACGMRRRELSEMYEDALEGTLSKAQVDPESENAGGQAWQTWLAAGVAALATGALAVYLKVDRK